MPIPFVIAAIATAAKVGSTIAGSVNEANAIREQAFWSREEAKINNELLEIQRQDVIRQGAREGGKIREAAGRMESDQIAAYAAQGIDVSSGSAALVRADTNYLAEIDALEVKNNAIKAAFGYRINQIQNTITARNNSAAASNRAGQTLVSGGLGAISDIASAYKNYQTQTKGVS
jgi:hypothetical protein